MMLTADDVMKNRTLLENAEVFHFGTLSMTDEPAREALRVPDICKRCSFHHNYQKRGLICNACFGRD